MAPEPAILKRKRSRPSDWWAAAPVSSPAPQSQAQPRREETKHKKRLNVSERHTQALEPPVAPNLEEGTVREIVVKKKRGRPSLEAIRQKEQKAYEPLDPGARRTLQAPNSAHKDDADDSALPSKKRVRISLSADDVIVESADDVSPGEVIKKRNRNAIAAKDKELDEEVQSVGVISQKNRTKKPMLVTEDAVETTRPDSGKSYRRGRSSHTEAEVQAIFEQAVYNKKYAVNAVQSRGSPAQPSMASPELEEVSEDNSAPQISNGTPTKNTRQRSAKRGQRSKPAPAAESTSEDEIAPRPLSSQSVDHPSLDISRLGRSPNSKGTPAISKQAAKPTHKGEKRGNATSARVSSSEAATGENIQTEYKDKKKNDVAPLRRGRSSNTEAEVQAIFEDVTRPYYKGKNIGDHARGRRSGTVLEVETATSNFGRGRPKKRSQPAPLAAPSKPSRTNRHRQGVTEISPPKEHRKKSKTSSNVEARPRKKQSSKSAPNEKLRTKKQHQVRELQTEAASDEDDEEVEEGAYQHLIAMTRKVSRHTIESKWEPLPSGCIDRVSQLLEDIQRPVIVHLNEEKKRIQASTALHMVSRKLVSKISKGLPFPQGTRNHREDDFDFERILDHNRALEALLTPALHANALLEAESAKEAALLEADQELLAELESNAKKESISRKQVGRKVHPLLQTKSSNLDDDDSNRLGLSNGFLPMPPLFHGDDSLHGVIKDLGGHMESIEGNISQVQGITEAVAKSKAAVQATLFNHLASSQYEDVVLG